jgi:hypothetical protein
MDDNVYGEKLRIIGGIEDRVKMVLAEHGDKALNVLKAALERARELDERGYGIRFGDFDYRGLKQYLDRMGFRYNPSLLLRKMERDYAIIETTYKSANKHWWRFVDRKKVEKTIYPERVSRDPESLILRAKYVSISPSELLEILEEMKNKERLDKRDIRMFRRIVFDDADKIVELYGRMSERQSLYEKELETLSKILRDIEIISDRLRE